MMAARKAQGLSDIAAESSRVETQKWSTGGPDVVSSCVRTLGSHAAAWTRRHKKDDDDDDRLIASIVWHQREPGQT